MTLQMSSRERLLFHTSSIGVSGKFGVGLSVNDYSMLIIILTHFSPVPHFYTPRKRQKTFGFLTV